MAYNFNKKFLEKHYVQELKGITTIAKEVGCFPEQVRRALKKYNIPLRSKSQSLKHYYENGGEPALKGQTLSQDYKDMISRSMREYWDGLPKKERDKKVKEFVQQTKDGWDKMSEGDRQLALYMMNKARFATIKTGSKMQNDVRDLISEHYLVLTEIGNLRGGNKLRIDLFLPKFNIAIEIDGPSHYEPIYGDDALRKTQARDKRKNKILTESGINVIRVKLPHKTYCRATALAIYERLMELLKQPSKLNKITYVKVK